MLRSDEQCGDSRFELEVLHELSHARSNPSAVAEALRNRLPHFKDKDYFPPERGGKTAVVTKEGQAAVRDAISFLEHTTRLPALADVCMQGLRLAAEDHLLDLGTRGAIGHQGADGSISSERMSRYGSWSGKCGECLWFGRVEASAKKIVEDLIVDDGVPSRGHRMGIYDPCFHVAGVRMGTHKTFGACCVIEFAACYVDDEESLINRVTAGPPAVHAGKEQVKTQWIDLGQCPGCKQAIHGGAVMEALGHKWHRDCFACQADGCGQKLRGVPWQEHGGMPFCKDCYYTRFGSTCNGCGEKIHGGVLKASGHTWHKECFVCSTCRGPLETRYTTHDGKPVCNSCSGSALCKAAPAGRGAGDALRKPLPYKAAAVPKVGARAKTPPLRAGAVPRAGVQARTPPPKAGARSKTPPPVKSGALAAAGRGAMAKGAPKMVPMGTAKRATDALIMDYADLA